MSDVKVNQLLRITELAEQVKKIQIPNALKNPFSPFVDLHLGREHIATGFSSLNSSLMALGEQPIPFQKELIEIDDLLQPPKRNIETMDESELDNLLNSLDQDKTSEVRKILLRLSIKFTAGLGKANAKISKLIKGVDEIG